MHEHAFMACTHTYAHTCTPIISDPLYLQLLSWDVEFLKTITELCSLCFSPAIDEADIATGQEAIMRTMNESNVYDERSLWTFEWSSSSRSSSNSKGFIYFNRYEWCWIKSCVAIVLSPAWQWLRLFLEYYVKSLFLIIWNFR